jgi:hypothetical protein
MVISCGNKVLDNVCAGGTSVSVLYPRTALLAVL